MEISQILLTDQDYSNLIFFIADTIIHVQNTMINISKV